MSTRHHSGFMADHLDGLAASIDGPIPPSETDIHRATLRGLSHVARVSDETLHRVQGAERRLDALEKRDGKMDALERRLDEQARTIADMQRTLGEREAAARAAWWTVGRIALAAAALTASAWAVFVYANPKS